jgi:hypothetical protein
MTFRDALKTDNIKLAWEINYKLNFLGDSFIGPEYRDDQRSVFDIAKMELDKHIQRRIGGVFAGPEHFEFYKKLNEEKKIAFPKK